MLLLVSHDNIGVLVDGSVKFAEVTDDIKSVHAVDNAMSHHLQKITCANYHRYLPVGILPFLTKGILDKKGKKKKERPRHFRIANSAISNS